MVLLYCIIGHGVVANKALTQRTNFLSLFFSLSRCIQDPVISQHIVNVMAIEYDLPDVSEDCLYLNVYTPKEAATVKRLPVSYAVLVTV